MDLFNPYKKLLYKRGFIFLNKKIKPPHYHWKSERINQFWLFYDPDLGYSINSLGNKTCIILGYVIDIFHPSFESSTIGSNLIMSYIKSREEFLNYIDNLSGRFIILCNFENHYEIYQDACGTRSVYYSTDTCVVSSHFNLLIENLDQVCINQHLTGLLEKYSSYHLPGNYTFYKNVYILTPNTFLLLPSMEVKRFFPREPIQLQKPENCFETVTELISNLIQYLANNLNLIVSITAGLDSRATLALSKEFKDSILYFTYYKSNNKGLHDWIDPILLKDKETALDIAQKLKINHKLLNIDFSNQKSLNFILFSNVMRKHTIFHHSYYLAWLYYNDLPHNSLHVRSNVNEIFRNFYRKNLDLPNNITTKTMALCYSKKAINDENIQNLFESYYSTTQFGKIYDYDPYDLLYWEYRLGVWFTNILLESDVSHDTFCLFNNRFIIKNILSMPASSIRENYLLRNLINKYWPKLNDWEINSDGYLLGDIDSYYDEIKTLSFEAKNIYTGNQLPYLWSLKNGIITFYLNVNAPINGDVAKCTKFFITEINKNYSILIKIQSPYERTKNKGRMVFRVILNHKKILEEDVALRSEPNNIMINYRANSSENTLEFEVLAIKDCENWGWGPTAKITIKEISILKTNNTSVLTAHSDSPFSILFVDKSN
jgi:hypothetical protein